MPLALAVVAIGTTVYGAVQANKASRAAAQVDTATAEYNAKYDEAMSAQLALDTNQNIKTERKENAVYLSKQHVSYASAGVLANTGSALDAQLINAGRLEQHIQQTWVDMNQKQQQYASAAKVGRLEGSARATADRAQGTIALINGAASVSRQLFGAYQSGMFSS